MKRLMLMLSLVGLAVAMTAVGGGPKDTGRGLSKPVAVSGAQNDADRQRIAEAYGKLPLSFEANEGQTDRRVKFTSRGAGYTLFVTSDETVLALNKSKENAETPERLRHVAQPEKRSQAVLRIKLVGGNANARAKGVAELAEKSNYFIGDDRTKWRTNVPNYSKVKLQDVYPGIDLVYYGNQRQLEEDFVVAPGADPTAISMKIGGADNVSIENGELVLAAEGGEVRLRKPMIYQETPKGRREVEGGYALGGKKEVKFEVAEFDRTRPLVIDPVLAYSTYLGGSGYDLGLGIAVDTSGNAYVTGYTQSMDFPGTSSSLIQSANGGLAGFVTKLSSDGSAVVYSTYLGGNSNNDYCTAIAVDSSGNAYVTGQTASTNFPGTSTSPIQSAYAGGSGRFRSPDAFVTKINAAGTALVYSTYLGGSSSDRGQGIAVDPSGNAYVTGTTSSTDFPGTGSSPIQSVFSGTQTNYFVTGINAAGTALLYSTYLGGNGPHDAGNLNGIAVDSSGNAYVTGATSSTNFPGTSLSSIQSTYGGGYYDAFVTEINAAGTALVYSTYLGGDNYDVGYNIAVDSSGNAYVTGLAESNFPGTGSSLIQSSFGGGTDVFVTEINAGGTALVYSTYLGGRINDYGTGIAVDSSGNAYVTGSSQSTNFPVTTSSPIQSAFGGGDIDAFVAEINAGGTALVYSTYLGGSQNDFGNGVAVDSSGNAYVTGYTVSTDFPGTSSSPIQSTHGGGYADAYVVKIGNAKATPVITWAVPAAINYGTALSGNQLNATANVAGNFVYTPAAGTILQAGTSTLSVTFTPTDTTDDTTATASVSIEVNANGNLTISSGQTYTFVNGKITGNIVMSGGTLVLSSSTVGGNLQASGGSLSLSNSTVGNDLQVTGAVTFSIGPAVSIGGNLQIQSLPVSAGTDQVCGASVKGSLTFQHSGTAVLIGSATGCAGNSTGGDLTVQNNTAPTTIDHNTVGGNLTDQNNTAATQVFTNGVTKNLSCSGDPSITGGGNTASSKQGQCATF